MITESQIRSHGKWPVQQLRAGHTIRFHSRNYGKAVIMRIERIRWYGKIVVASGISVSGVFVSDIAFGQNERVELVSVCDEKQRQGYIKNGT